jgi:hypothetical protein
MRFARFCGLLVMTMSAIAGAQSKPSLPPGLDDATVRAIEVLADSMRAGGLPADPLYAKAAEGKLKQASDAQILSAVRALASRFRQIRAGLGPGIAPATMSAAATALSAGIPIATIRDMRDAAAGARDPAGDLAGALVTLADLVGQRVPQASAISAVQSLLARHAAPEQFARLRIGVSDIIGSGRTPDQAVRATTEAIVKTLPSTPPSSVPVKPPIAW